MSAAFLKSQLVFKYCKYSGNTHAIISKKGGACRQMPNNQFLTLFELTGRKVTRDMLVIQNKKIK